MARFKNSAANTLFKVDRAKSTSSSVHPAVDGPTQTRAPTALQQRLSFETLRSGVFIPLKAAAFSSHTVWENPID
eukprot:6478345-Amphidinium_carterae.1